MFPGQEGDYGGGPTLPLSLDSYFYALSLACPSWPGYLVWASLFVGPLSHPPVLLERHGCKHPSFFLFFFFPHGAHPCVFVSLRQVYAACPLFTWTQSAVDFQEKVEQRIPFCVDELKAPAERTTPNTDCRGTAWGERRNPVGSFTIGQGCFCLRVL